MQAIEDTLYDAFGQRQISTIFGQANQYRVVLEADPLWQSDPNSLRLLRRRPQRSSPGATVRRWIDRRRSAPLVIAHQEQFPAVTLSFDLAPGSRWAMPSPSSRGPSKVLACRARLPAVLGDAAEFESSPANPG